MGKGRKECMGLVFKQCLLSRKKFLFTSGRGSGKGRGNQRGGEERDGGTSSK